MMKIYAIFDEAIESYGQPIFTRTAGQALRSFSDEVKNPESPFNKHPEDYSIYYMGEFNEQTGIITPADPTRLARATEYKEN